MVRSRSVHCLIEAPSPSCCMRYQHLIALTSWINRHVVYHSLYLTRATPPRTVLYRRGLQQIGCRTCQPAPVDVFDGTGLEDARLSTPASSDFAVDGSRWWVLSGTKCYKYIIGTCPRNGLTTCENQAFDNNLFIGNSSIKNAASVATMVGPDGVSNSNDPYMPMMTETTPNKHARSAIVSGERASCRAVAGAITSIEAIKRIPTILIETAITTVIKSIKITCIRKTDTFSAIAKSSWIVIKTREDQFNASSSSTKHPPNINHHNWALLTVKISPKRYPCRSIRWSRRLMVMTPTANAACAKIPNNVSVSVKA